LPSETELLELALMAYEAATEPEVWPVFLKRYAEAVSANIALLQVHDLAAHSSFAISTFGMESPFTRSYNEHYSKLNIWRERGGQGFYYPGRVNLGEEQCPRAVLERSEFYNDYLLRIRGVCSMGAVIAREGDRAPALTALRGPRKDPFGESEREMARFLVPHLSRAWTVLKRLDLLAAGESILDTLPVGVIFLTAGGVAIYCNLAAEEILRAEDGLLLSSGVLSAADRIADAQLRRAVQDALSPRSSPGAATLAIPRASLRPEYQITAAPVRGRFRQFVGTPTPMAVALITDPERQRPVSTDLLVQMYKLTPKETAIAAKLSEGKSIEQAAEEMAITCETARTHLRRIFSKTGTSRQTELILLMARLPGIPRNHNG
jgi:DNA-binding CsgD family transcriptional regulator/PAS domain-containing protein